MLAAATATIYSFFKIITVFEVRYVAETAIPQLRNDSCMCETRWWDAGGRLSAREEAEMEVPGTDGQVDRRNSPVFSWSL